MQQFKYQPQKLSYKKKLELEDLPGTHQTIFRDIGICLFLAMPISAFLIWLIIYLGETFNF